MNQIQGNKLLKNISDADTIVVLMAEYNTLRDEILKRMFIGIRYTMFSATVKL